MITPRQRIIQDITNIGALHRVTYAEIMGNSREHRITKARQAAYWCIWYCHGFNYPKVASFFGRNYRTVAMGIGIHMARCGMSNPLADAATRRAAEIREYALQRERRIRAEQRLSRVAAEEKVAA